MTAPIQFDFTGMVGSQSGVPMSLTYARGSVALFVAGMTVMTCQREDFADALVDSFPLLPFAVGEDFVVIDIPRDLPLHLVLDLADVEEFLDRALAADPEAIDEAELAAVLGGVR